MAATDQAIADAARDSLARILATDAAEMSEGQRKLRQLEISELRATIDEFEGKANRGSRRIFAPVKRVDV